MYIFRAAAEANKAAGFLLKNAGQVEGQAGQDVQDSREL